jgi:hypothetical protein
MPDRDHQVLTDSAKNAPGQGGSGLERGYCGHDFASDIRPRFPDRFQDVSEGL